MFGAPSPPCSASGSLPPSSLWAASQYKKGAPLPFLFCSSLPLTRAPASVRAPYREPYTSARAYIGGALGSLRRVVRSATSAGASLRVFPLRYKTLSVRVLWSHAALRRFAIKWGSAPLKPPESTCNACRLNTFGIFFKSKKSRLEVSKQLFFIRLKKYLSINATSVIIAIFRF